MFAATCDKALASYDAAVALIVPGHQLDYRLAALYVSLCSWERFFAHGGLPELLRYWPPLLTLLPLGRFASSLPILNSLVGNWIRNGIPSMTLLVWFIDNLALPIKVSCSMLSGLRVDFLS